MSHHFFTEDNVATELTFVRLFRKLWPMIWQHKKSVIKALCLVGLFILVGRSLPFLFGYAIDQGIQHHNRELILWVAGSYLLLETLRGGLSFFQTDRIQRLGNMVLFEIRERLISHVQRLPVSYFEKNPSGRTVTRVTNDVYALGELFSQGFAAIFVSVIEMVSIFVSLAIISWQMTGATILVLPPLTWLCIIISKKIRFQFGAAKRKLSMINAFTAETLGGIKILQLFGRTHESRQFFNLLSAEYRSLQLSTVRLFATLWPLIEAFNVMTLAIALFLGAYFHKYYGVSIGHLSAYILLLQGFFKPLKTILERYNQLQNSLASADRVFQLLDEPQETLHGKSFSQAQLNGLIEIKDLSFRYGKTLPLVLKNINLTIKPGMSVAIVGRTGSGKSSLISLLQKLYKVEQGDILIDGISIKELAPQSIRPRIGVVQQDGFVFSGTILNNITLGEESISKDRAIWAAKQAQCDDILSRQGGIEAVLQERGTNLSAGERQLLAFARVLAFSPDILILDEATANIDSVSERHIQIATEVATKGRTSIIIAHRLSTILHCDLIVVMDQGRIAEMGRHEELLAVRGKYYGLYQASQTSSANSKVDPSSVLSLNS